MSNPTEEITKLMDTYKQRMSEQETADEMNRNTQHLYLYDYIYLFGKVLLFILLGLAYYLWVGKKEVTDAYDTTQTVIQETVNKANEKLREIKEINPVTSK
jgi:hypothetical protein